MHCLLFTFHQVTTQSITNRIMTALMAAETHAISSNIYITTEKSGSKACCSPYVCTRY